MRMWMLNPKIMCHNHLAGEWRELFTIVDHLQRKRKVDKYITNNCLELQSIQERYVELKKEKKRRKHKKFKQLPLDYDISYLPQEHQEYKVDTEASLKDLLSRCEKCKRRYENVKP